MDYIDNADHFYTRCPRDLQHFLGHRFAVGLDDEGRIDTAQLSLRDKTSIAFPDAKNALMQKLNEPAHLTLTRTKVHQIQWLSRLMEMLSFGVYPTAPNAL